MLPCPVCLKPDAASYMDLDGVSYRICSHCLSIFTDPKDLLSLEAEHSRYLLHENDPDDPGYRRFLERLAEPVAAHLAPASRGLDYGCGPTPLLAHIMEEKGHVMDIYDPYFFPDRTPLSRQYDFITCSEAAEHFHHPGKEFSRLASMLKPGAILGIMTSLWDESIDFPNWYYRKDPTHVVFYHQQTFLTLAEKLDLTCSFPEKNIILLRNT